MNTSKISNESHPVEKTDIKSTAEKTNVIATNKTSKPPNSIPVETLKSAQHKKLSSTHLQLPLPLKRSISITPFQSEMQQQRQINQEVFESLLLIDETKF